jgi:uncharacterized membrane protein
MSKTVEAKTRLNKRLERVATFALLACLIACIGATVYLAVSPKVGERFTEFYILGPSGKAEGYPTNLVLGESGTVIIGVVNHEYERVAYRIVVALDNETISTIENITLNHEEKWERNFTFTPQKVGERMKLEFLLYREGVEGPYRTLHLWVTVRPRV